ncbi:enoyl-CoA hydratase/isomerase family protein [Streptomyces sp. NPDC020792]|uniref:enoyl-CoA hydratase/isomerase family protein n=1 Tax=Streptomyces sp. NPDC020792 TaxID=3365089 RepID=UPI00379F623C
MTSTSRSLSVEDLAWQAARGGSLAPDGSLTEPVVTVDVTPDRAPVDVSVLHRAADRASAGDRLLVGVSRTPLPPGGFLDPLLDVLDLTLAPADDRDRRVIAVPDPEAEVEVLRSRICDHAQAAVVLAQLLRAGEADLTTHQALDVESFAYSTLLGGADFARWLALRGDRPAPPPATADPVLARRAGDTLYLTLNRPERRNAYGRELRDALVAALSVAELDRTVTSVVLDGAGPSFCSGGDLGEFGTTPDPATAHLVRTRAGAARPLHALRDRTTVRVHGSCVGAGIELPAFASRIVADPDALFRLPELDMGLIPGAGGTVSIPRRIGRWRTLYLFLSGSPLHADRACRWGLVDRLEPVDRPG